jgi:hypothetical protein
LSQYEIRVIPNMRVTTFGAKNQPDQPGGRGSVWRADANGRPSSSAPNSSRDRLRNDHWFAGTALPINPFIDPDLMPEQLLIAYNGRLFDMPMIDTGPWWGRHRSNAFWLEGEFGARPHAETASKLWHQVKEVLPLVNGQWVIDKVKNNMVEPDKFKARLDELRGVLARVRAEYGIQVTAEDLLDDQYRIPAQIPHSVGLDFTPGGWRLIGVEKPTPEAYANFTANIDAAIFVVKSPGGFFA